MTYKIVTYRQGMRERIRKAQEAGLGTPEASARFHQEQRWQARKQRRDVLERAATAVRQAAGKRGFTLGSFRRDSSGSRRHGELCLFAFGTDYYGLLAQISASGWWGLSDNIERFECGQVERAR